MHLPDPKLPPLFTGHAVIAPVRPLADACRGAADGHYGAGDFVWSRASDHMSIALVLEPDVTLDVACQMNALAHVALIETLGHLCPPQMSVLSRWPGIVLASGAVCGRIELVAPSVDPNTVPRWLVIGIDVTIAPDRHIEPGDRLDRTSLADEGCASTRTDLIEAAATRLLAWLHTWQTDGFRPIHDQWLFHAEGREQDVEADGVRGRIVGLDQAGGLVVKPRDQGSVRVLPFLPHLQVPT